MIKIPLETLSRPRRWLKKFHPEKIPGPGAFLYNLISGSKVFLGLYEVISRDIADHVSKGRVLDIGTGPGRLLIKLHETAPALTVMGLDISPAMAAKARRNLARAGLERTVDIKEGAAADLPFEDDSFEAVISSGSIHHWKDPTACLNEIHRVLKPGGIALLYDIVSDTPRPIVKEMAGKYGRAGIWLLWLHSFEEPFYSRRGFDLLPRPSRFEQGETRFVGAMYRLKLRK